VDGALRDAPSASAAKSRIPQRSLGMGTETSGSTKHVVIQTPNVPQPHTTSQRWLDFSSYNLSQWPYGNTNATISLVQKNTHRLQPECWCWRTGLCAQGQRWWRWGCRASAGSGQPHPPPAHPPPRPRHTGGPACQARRSRGGGLRTREVKRRTR
jgi:hypothetical protein